MEDKTKVKEEIGGYLSGLLGSIKGAIDSIGSLTGNVRDTVASGKPSTYEEWMNTRVDTLKADKKSQIDYLDEYQKSQEAALTRQKDLAVQGAQTERQRAYTDANTAYQQGLSQYGINAERLASMGLRGSGYSDYLSASAYSTERAEKAAANAQERATVANAENVYYTGKQTLADSVMREKNAINSTYSQMIDQAYGDSLKYAEDKKKATQNAEIESMIASGDNVGAVIAGIESGTTTKEVGKNTIKSLITVDGGNLPSFDFEGLALAKDKGYIDDADVDEKIDEYKSYFDPDNAFIAGDEEMDFVEAENALKKYEKYAYMFGDDAEKYINSIKDTYAAKYGISHSSVETDISDKEDGKLTDGTKITVKLPTSESSTFMGSFTVKVSNLEGENSDMLSSLKTKAKQDGVGENEPFVFRGKVYFYRGDKVYGLKDSGSIYERLVNYIKREV
jgi:hypothetical protein